MFASDDDYNLCQRVAVANSSTAAVYVDLNLRTDRHELLILSSAGDTFALAMAHPQRLGTDGDPDLRGMFAAPADVPSVEWVELAAQATVLGAKGYVLNGYGKYLRVTPPGGGATAAATVLYRPLPSTSES